jgi:REP element-mobilizing transposase RayT
MDQYPIYYPQFYTATVLEWKPLLKPHKYKEIIVSSLQYLTANKQITLYAFVIMHNHIHLIWQALPGKSPNQVQQSFMKYTAQQIKFDLVEHHPQVLDKFRVNAKDRIYQFWERNSLGIELRTHEVFMQKLEYIHWNPVKAGLCSLPEEYYFSSARFYWTGVDDFNMLTHC